MRLTKDEVKETADLLGYSCHDHASINRLVDHIKALETENERLTAWISVDDELPAKGEKVDIWENNGHNLIGVYWEEKGWRIFYTTGLKPPQYKVTFWRHRPKNKPDTGRKKHIRMERL